MHDFDCSGILRFAAAGALVVGTLGALPPAPAAADMNVERIVSGRGGQYQPAAAPGFLAWERNTRGRPGHYDVLVRRGDRTFVVNPRRYNAANGGIDGHQLVYQQFRRKRSNLKFFDLVLRDRSNPPAGVNTKAWEYWPSRSGKWLLFGRVTRSGARRVILFNLNSGRHRILSRTISRRGFTAPGQVNGDYAVWYRCPPRRHCNVFRYRISRRRTKRIPNGGYWQRAPSVTDTGAVYLARARGPRCEAKVRLVRFKRGHFKRVHDVPPGRHIGDTYAVTDGFENRTVYFDRFDCNRTAAADIFRARDPRKVPLRVARSGPGLVVSDPSGIFCGSDCERRYRAGASVTLSAAAAEDADFLGWSGDCLGRGPCTLTMDVPKSVGASFGASHARLDVGVHGDGEGQVTSDPEGIDCGDDCSHDFERGITVTLEADSDKDSDFAGWFGACTGRDDCVLTMDRDHEVGAVFEEEDDD